MKLLALAAAAALAFSPVAALAQHHEQHGGAPQGGVMHGGPHGGPVFHGGGGDHRFDRNGRFDRDGRFHDFRFRDRDPFFFNDPFFYGPSYVPSYSYYYSGNYLPSGYEDYAFYDYEEYGYAPPPYGYRYYRLPNGEIVLAAIATGIITAIIAGALH